MVATVELMTDVKGPADVAFRMTSRVTEYEPPARFVDEQVSGPFGYMRHEHRFEPCATGTRMIDRVEFAAPLGPIGRIAEGVVRRHLRKLLTARARFLKDQAER